MICTKTPYNSYSQAQGMVNLGKKRRIRWRKHKRPARSYKCPHCGYWHITSKKGEK